MIRIRALLWAFWLVVVPAQLALADHDDIPPMSCAVAVTENESSIYRGYVDFDCEPAGQGYQICVATLDCTVEWGGFPEEGRDTFIWQSEPFLLPEPNGLVPGLLLLAAISARSPRHR